MIFYVVAVNDQSVYSEWTAETLKQFKDSVVIEVENEENDSIFKKYNRGLKLANPTPDDQVCFIHEDVKILDPEFENKVKMVFEMKPNTGILGVIGSTEYTGLGWWHADRSKHFGQIEQGVRGGKTFRMVKKVGFNQNMVIVDGCMMVFSGKFLQGYKFDEENYPKAFHFYDVDSCLECLTHGMDVVSADILICHRSEGPMGPIWEDAKQRMTAKWFNRGVRFPVTKDSFKGK